MLGPKCIQASSHLHAVDGSLSRILRWVRCHGINVLIITIQHELFGNGRGIHGVARIRGRHHVRLNALHKVVKGPRDVK